MVSDGIVRIHGLADAMYGEMIEFDGIIWYGTEPRTGFSGCRCFR